MPLWLSTLSPAHAEVTIMPPFQPNEYLWKTHADKGTEKWEIFAWAVRDLMAKVGGFGKHDQSFKEKITLYNYYVGKVPTYFPKKEGEQVNSNNSENKKTQ